MNNTEQKDLERKDLYACVLFNNGNFIGISPVLFGFRIKMGFIENINTYYEADYCAGDNPMHIASLYSICYNIAKYTNLRTLPLQKQKPVSVYPEFYTELIEYCNLNHVDIKSNVPDLSLLSDFTKKYKEYFC